MQLTGTLSYILYAASIASAAPLEKRAYTSGKTATDVTDGVCAPITLIFARGSTEGGNMGSSVGPALAKELISQLGASGVAIQGVDYTASIESNVYMGSKGGPVMATLAEKALANCPNTKIAISGYSQGGSVCHYAVKSGGLDYSTVSSAVIYGDPEYKKSVGDLPASQVKEFCASGDGVCEDGTFAISAAHLSYASSSDIATGAAFIIAAAGGSSTTSSASSTTSSAAASSTSSSLGIFSGLFTRSVPALTSLPGLFNLTSSSGTSSADAGKSSGTASSGFNATSLGSALAGPEASLKSGSTGKSSGTTTSGLSGLTGSSA
ncbi:hypothetical protein LTR08_002071 [Meristemomyces frigidus]|nr:hypothetical protein LTR08_002071 [Meristemomyces frigidus]